MLCRRSNQGESSGEASRPRLFTSACKFALNWDMAKSFLRAVRSEVVSPKPFLGIVAEQRSNIASVDVRPPKLGTGGFGKIIVRYKYFLLKPQHAG
jgi:hypothetical protein